MTEADELLKYKELLDSGIITKEEFDRKKKEIFKTDESNEIKIDEEGISENYKLSRTNVVVSWVFFAFFALSTLGMLKSNYNIFLLFLDVLITLTCCPVIIEKLQEKTRKQISASIRIIIILICLMIFGLVNAQKGIFL